MRTLALILVLGLVLGACSKSPFSKARSLTPIHNNLQIVIDATKGGSCITEPGLKDTHLDSHTRVSFKGTLSTGAGPECSAVIEYRGTENEKDYYWVTVTAPPGAVGVPLPAEIAYEGREIELWKDADWRVRLRPVPAATGSQPIRSETNSMSSAADSRR